MQTLSGNFIWVVKLGGSLHESPHLVALLEALAQSAVIIVPGGGPFADQVRASQKKRAYDDATAHAMAVLAMAQYGLMLKGLCPHLLATEQIPQLTPLASTGSSVVWLPNLELLTEPEIPQTWEVTSDSLAAWLTKHLNLPRLLLVKSTGWPGHSPTLAQLTQSGLIDSAFSRFVADSTLTVWLAQDHDHPHLRQGLQQPERVFLKTG